MNVIDELTAAMDSVCIATPPRTPGSTILESGLENVSDEVWSPQRFETMEDSEESPTSSFSSGRCYSLWADDEGDVANDLEVLTTLGHSMEYPLDPPPPYVTPTMEGPWNFVPTPMSYLDEGDMFGTRFVELVPPPPPPPYTVFSEPDFGFQLGPPQFLGMFPPFVPPYPPPPYSLIPSPHQLPMGFEDHTQLPFQFPLMPLGMGLPHGMMEHRQIPPPPQFMMPQLMLMVPPLGPPPPPPPTFMPPFHSAPPTFVNKGRPPRRFQRIEPFGGAPPIEPRPPCTPIAQTRCSITLNPYSAEFIPKSTSARSIVPISLQYRLDQPIQSSQEQPEPDRTKLPIVSSDRDPFSMECMKPHPGFSYYVPPRVADSDYFGGQIWVWQEKIVPTFDRFLPDAWSLQGLPRLSSETGDDWYNFTITAKLRFCCRKCFKPWTSMRGKIHFTFRLDKPLSKGMILMKIFGQVCNREGCDDPRFQNPACYPEDIHRVLIKLSEYIGFAVYESPLPPTFYAEPDKAVRTGNPKSPHRPALCQACQLGICSKQLRLSN